MNIAFDLETTGIDPFNDVPVSYAMVQDDGVYYSQYINPGRDIAPEATKIHGITDDMARQGEILLLAIARIIRQLNTYWANGDVIVGMNVSYDLTMIAAQAKKLDLPELEVGTVLDVLVIDRHCDKWRKGSRKLQSLADYYKVELTEAHTAEADCQACLSILDKMYVHYPYLKNVDFTNNKTLESWYRRWLIDYSKHLVETGNKPIPVGRYKWPIHSTLESLQDA